MEFVVEVYVEDKERCPYEDWLAGLDSPMRQKMHMKLARVALGNFGLCKSLSGKLYELKIDAGPGYRIYFALIGVAKILVLLGGSKRAQQRDIEKAKKFLKDFQEKNYGKK